MKTHNDDFENAKKNKMLDRWGYAFFFTVITVIVAIILD